MTLGEKIRDARRKCGLSQEQLAEKMCVSRSAIAKWETDKGLPDVGNLKLLARLLSVSVDHLLDEAEPTDSPVIREAYNLASYGRGCKKVKKDRVIRQKFPEAKIIPLLGQQELPPMDQDMDAAMDCRMGTFPSAANYRSEPDKAFYLVEKEERQFLITVADAFMETRPLEQPVHGNSFQLDGWRFIKCNYEVEK